MEPTFNAASPIDCANYAEFEEVSGTQIHQSGVRIIGPSDLDHGAGNSLDKIYRHQTDTAGASYTSARISCLERPVSRSTVRMWSRGTCFHWDMACGATPHNCASALTLPAFSIARVIGLGLMAPMKDILSREAQGFLSMTGAIMPYRIKE